MKAVFFRGTLWFKCRPAGMAKAWEVGQGDVCPPSDFGRIEEGCANKDLWCLCAPIFIIVVYSKTATSYYFGAKE